MLPFLNVNGQEERGAGEQSSLPPQAPEMSPDTVIMDPSRVGQTELGHLMGRADTTAAEIAGQRSENIAPTVGNVTQQLTGVNINNHGNGRRSNGRRGGRGGRAGLNGTTDRHWAAENATDIQQRGDFDFEANLAQFDRNALFAQLREQDNTKGRRLVDQNRRPGPSGTGLPGHLRPNENVLEGRRAGPTVAVYDDTEVWATGEDPGVCISKDN